MSREFIIPKKIIMGDNAVSDSAEYIRELGKKALIVTGKHVVKLECFKSVTNLLEKLGIEYSIFTGITGEPTDTMINEGLAVYKSDGCDFLIGIGGGSPLDSIKAIAALSVNGGKISDYMGKTITGNLPPMVAVITDSEKDIKMLLKGVVLIPDIAIVDSEFSATSPKSITAATGLDALTHAVESYTSRKAQPLTDAVALSAVKRIFRYLPRAYKDGTDKKAREEMSVAALEAGIAINNASVTIVHGMSRPIGANFHVAHGISNAMLLEKCMAFALDGAYDRFADLGRATGTDDASDDDKTAAEKFLAGLGDICRVCEVPTLEEYGIDKDKFFSLADKMADDALASGSPGNTIKKVTKQDVLDIYSQLW